jgi:rSAM/selenodomain-associated transferase 2
MKPDISIIIPVMNETAIINTALKMLLKQKFSGMFEVIVVDGNSQGTTIGCIDHPDVLKITALPGRGAQMNAGAAVACGKNLLFLHCDTLLPRGGLESIHTVLKNPSIQAGAFDLSIQDRGFFFRMVEKTASFRSRITKIPYGDQAIFIRTCFFNQIGRYRHIPIMEDVDLMVRIKKAGGRIQFIDQPAATASRRWREEGRVYSTLRNWTLMLLFFFGVAPERLARFYQIRRDRSSDMA